MPDSIDRARDALEAAETRLAVAEDAGASRATIEQLLAEYDSAEDAYFDAVDNYARA